MRPVLSVDQGSLAWYEARLGKPTSSQFHKIVTPGGKPSSQSIKYMYRLIAETLLHEVMDDYIGYVRRVEDGKLLEPDAASQWEFTHDPLRLEPGGFVTTADGRIGCSPDRIVAGRAEGVEIKCPAPWTHLQYLIEGPGDDYKPQVQGQLMIAEFEAVRFYSYSPKLPPAEIVTHPDRKFIRVMSQLLTDFLEQMDERLARCRALGAYVTSRSLVTPMQAAFPETGPDPLQIILPD